MSTDVDPYESFEFNNNSGFSLFSDVKRYDFLQRIMKNLQITNNKFCLQFDTSHFVLMICVTYQIFK